MGLNTTSPEPQSMLGSWLQYASTGRIFGTLVAALLIPLCITIVHRLYIHPLRVIPGPWLAAVSNAYGFYYNYNDQEGGYSRQFQKLHKKYSMFISISGLDAFLFD
jgi:hypothetical protein